MQTRYKVIISSQVLYREIELTADQPRLTVGTAIECDVRLHKSSFFEPVELTFTQTREGWVLGCSDNLYITEGDVRKLMTRQLVHGDSLQIKYYQSDYTVFHVDFLIDFDDGKRRYQRCVDISGAAAVSIGGGSGNDIILRSPYAQKDDILLKRTGSSYQLSVRQSQFGVYHNGIKVTGTKQVYNGDFLYLADFFFYLKDGQLWTEIREDLQVRRLKVYDRPDQGAYPLFKRSTRVKSVLSEEKITVLDPPPKPQKPKNNLFMQLLPSMGMMISAAAMAAMGSGAMIAMSAVSGGMAVLTAILNFTGSNKDFKDEAANRVTKYNSYIDRKCQEIRQLREEERLALEKQYIPQQEQRRQFDQFSPSLFDRAAGDEDFLTVRLGSGSRDALRVIDYKKQDRLESDDDLQLIPERLCQDFKRIENAPVVCDLKKTGAVGICGPETCRFSMMKNLVVDIAARQFFSDVELVFVAEEQNRDKIHWLRLLPHVQNEAMGTRNIVCNDESKNLIFEYLYKELTLREESKHFQRRIVVFFYDEYGFGSHPISKFADKARDLGVTFLFFAPDRARIPMGCGYVVELKNEISGVLIDSSDLNQAQEFVYPTISDSDAKAIANLLAPVYTEEISLESSLTKNISMFEMLNIIAVDDLDLADRWAGSQVTKSMAAPLGVSKTGTVYLDLHDKAHGPHGLVAGTTGSGKSEILQTYILAMSTLYHPYEVGFVIIDFKGGGMVNQFRSLPHLMGAITDIDGRQINRSLKSIKAELEKRKRCFAEADVNHIDKYIKKYKAGQVSQPLPHLIIIVDEFAELKAEQPEFMKELISAARIGRSLGVHLILATQKPSGQVNEQIWSNSRFKLCLKVQSQQDSNEVIKSPLAAEIQEPGRAYLQVGNNEIFELFQSAYSGVSEKTEDSDVKEFTIYSLTDSGKRIPVYQQKKQRSGEGSATQLDAIVRYVDEYCEQSRIARLPDICLPALEPVLDFPEQESLPGSGNIIADIGVLDDPENQYQGIYSLDLTAQNLMIIGSSQSGKTNLLQTVIRSVTSRYTPAEVSIYILDFASMVLKNFDRLAHVGGVVTSSEDEKYKNLMKMLRSEVESRKEKLVSAGVSSFSAYKEAGQTDLPQILLIIDNLTALKELYLHDEDEVLTLCREGLSVGISVIIANSQTSGIGYRYLSNFAGRIALFCNDSSEYNALLGHCTERPGSIPGRCVIEVEKRHLECQSYLAYPGEKEYQRVRSIREYIDRTNQECRGLSARRIPLIPNSLTALFMLDQFGSAMQMPFRVAAGLDYATVTPWIPDLAAMGVLSVTGRDGMGRHNWVRYMVTMLDTMYPGQTQVQIVDSVGKRLQSLSALTNVMGYGVLAEDAVTAVISLEAQLKRRYEALALGDENALNQAPLLMLILDNPDALAAISANKEALAAYKNIIGRYKNMRWSILELVDNMTIPYSAPELLKNIRDSKTALVFDDINSLKLFDPPIPVLRAFKKPIDTGDCYFIRENACLKLKTPLCHHTPAKQ